MPPDSQNNGQKSGESPEDIIANVKNKEKDKANFEDDKDIGSKSDSSGNDECGIFINYLRIHLYFYTFYYLIIYKKNFL